MDDIYIKAMNYIEEKRGSKESLISKSKKESISNPQDEIKSLIFYFFHLKIK